MVSTKKIDKAIDEEEKEDEFGVGAGKVKEEILLIEKE